ncbi:hypothetical protein TcWFU_004041 [Taenia crassiceps]|uniref:WKF domain-containing protein n=1 Tax=Taenia crassiceps TaxID=6207 RepID=A0ABR4Q0G8_9CEST
MTIETVLGCSKKYQKFLEFSKGGQATEEVGQRSERKQKSKSAGWTDSRASEVSIGVETSELAKKRKQLPEVVTDSAEAKKPVSTRRQKSKRNLVMPKGNFIEGQRLEPEKKSVTFAKELVTLSNLPKDRLETSISKVSSLSARTSNASSEVEGANNTDRNGVEMKPRKPKKSKNALKRIKWVKRHYKKTFSRRKRRTNRELARSRPQRDAKQHLAEAVEYLKTWYSSPQTWKYKKVAQLILIKHAFNPVLIDEETFELLLHYLAGVQGAVVDRLRSMCQQLIDNGGAPPESPTFPLSIPCEYQDSSVVVERATKMLDFVLPSVAET